MKANLKLLAAGLVGAVSAMALSSAAFANPVKGIYGEVGLGPSWANPTGGASFKLGGDFAGAIGYSFGNGWRGEGEVSYFTDRANGYNHVRVGGQVHATSFLLNGIYDFDQYPLFAGVIPHVGAGIGYSNVTGGGFSVPGAISGRRVSFQGIAGVAYPITDAIKLDVDYRLIATPDVRFGVSPSPTKGNLLDHTLFFGLRFDFAPPPAPPAPAPVAAVAAPAAAPAPAPEPQRAFQVFFDFNKSDITSDAASIIRQAAATVSAGHLAKIDVTGHTDTVGSASYNQKLSERRADAVKAELIKDGVSADAISTAGVGKSGLLVPTPDGVREPQNRRAEIELK
jgi:OmpA-OmpF porin, OOP family